MSENRDRYILKAIPDKDIRQSIRGLLQISTRANTLVGLREDLRDCRQAGMISLLNRMLPPKERIPLIPWREINTGSIPPLDSNLSFGANIDSTMMEELKIARKEWRTNEHRKVVRVQLLDLGFKSCNMQTLLAFAASCGLKQCQRETIFRLFINNCFGEEERTIAFPREAIMNERGSVWPFYVTRLHEGIIERHLNTGRSSLARGYIDPEQAWTGHQLFLFEI